MPWGRVLRAAVGLLALLLLCRGITTPFNAWHELNSAMYSQFARNHIQYGLGYTRLYCTWGSTLEPPPAPERYLNHPPLIALLTAVPLVVLGDHEWTARLVPIVSSLGSVALLMAILGRLGRPGLGVLTGFFFAVLPLTAHFGRMIDHVAPAQFFTLLMIDGYLRWTGEPRDVRSRRRGAVLYATGAVLGIATAWAVVIAAGLVWAWHALRVRGGGARPRLLVWLAAIPGTALALVVLHIVAGAGGHPGILVALFEARTGGGVGARQPVGEWIAVQAAYFVRNFTPPGAAAAVLLVVLVARRALAWRPQDRPRSRWDDGTGGVVTVLCLQGLLYVFVFRSSAWQHDYWQFFLGPVVAVGLAVATLLAHAGLRHRSPKLAGLVVGLVLLAPLPWTARTLSFYGSQRLVDPADIDAFQALAAVVPYRAPVFTSRQWRTRREVLGAYTHTWPNPVAAYYANRPLVHSRDLAEVEANAPACAAYLLRRNARPEVRDLEEALSRRYDAVPAGPGHVVFRLDRRTDSGSSF